MSKAFNNPYLFRRDTVRVQTMVCREEYEHLQCIRPTTGTITTTVNLLFKKLGEALAREGIKDINDKQRFEEFITRCEIVKPQ